MPHMLISSSAIRRSARCRRRPTCWWVAIRTTSTFCRCRRLGVFDAARVCGAPLQHTLPALETRLALFVEGQHAFAAVLGRDHSVVGLDLEHHGAAEIHLHPEMDRVLGLAHRNRRVVGDAAAGVERLFYYPPRRAEPVDHTPLIRFGGGEGPSGEDVLFRPP